MNTLNFVGFVESKNERRTFSKLLKLYQFNCSEIKIGLETIPKAANIHKYHIISPYSTLREDVVETIKLLRLDGYKVKVDVRIKLNGEKTP